MTFFAILSSLASAGDLVKGAEITMIGNTTNGGDDFFIKVSGGTGPCVGQNLVFPVDAAASKEQHARAYSLALTAFTTGSKKIRAYNFNGGSCRSASYIEMSK